MCAEIYKSLQEHTKTGTWSSALPACERAVEGPKHGFETNPSHILKITPSSKKSTLSDKRNIQSSSLTHLDVQEGFLHPDPTDVG